MTQPWMKNVDLEITGAGFGKPITKLMLATLVPFEEELNQHLSIASYGTGLQKIFFVFLAFPADDTFHENDLTFNEAEHHLEVALRLDYDQLLTATPEKALQLMGRLYVEAIDLYRELPITGFDWDRFEADVREVLQRKGWW